MHEPKAKLPDYENPPVIEVVCGAQFEPLDGFTSTMFGTFWQTVRGEYPNAEDRPPLSPVVEETEGTKAKQLLASPLPPLRRVFLSGTQPNWLMQVQEDRFLHNWRKIEDSDEYPHYPKVSERFWKAWTVFCQFCEKEKLGLPHINQLEMTYVNHVPMGDGWDNLSDIGSVFPDFSWRPDHDFLPPIESAQWIASFRLPEDQGRLHVNLRHAIRTRDNRPVLLCELTARGVPRTTDESGVHSWFDMAREWIVRGFADLASKEAQTNVWKRRQ